jgi:AraC family transcriptional regulator
MGQEQIDRTGSLEVVLQGRNLLVHALPEHSIQLVASPRALDRSESHAQREQEATNEEGNEGPPAQGSKTRPLSRHACGIGTFGTEMKKLGMAVARPLFESNDLYFAELVCGPDDPEWGEENLVTHPIVALPATPVWQAHEGGPPTLVNANHAVFHHAGSEYHRERFQGNGYRCAFFFPSESLVREVTAEVDPSAASSTAYRFPIKSAPLEAPTFALARRLAGALAFGRVDRLRAREGLYAVLRSVVLSAYMPLGPRRAVRQSTARTQSEIVEEAKELITRRLAERLRLDDLATQLHVSPYHLARVPGQHRLLAPRVPDASSAARGP